MPKILLKVVVLATFCSFVQPSVAEIIVADNLLSTGGNGVNVGFDNSNNNSVNYATGQSFTPTRSGLLHTFSIIINRAEAQHDLGVSFYTVDSNTGRPDALLGTQVVPMNDVPPPPSAVLEVDMLGSGVHFTGGQPYAFLLWVPSGHDQWQYGLPFDNDEYPDGARLYGFKGNDLGSVYATSGDVKFRVTVPEPATITLLGLAGGALVRRRRS